MLPPYTGVVNPSTTYSLALTPGDGTKTVYIAFWTGTESITIIKSIILDTTAPTLPILTSPTNGAAATGAFNITRSWSSDTGVGLSGYQYFVATTGTLGVWVIKSWFTTSTTVAIANNELGTNGTFYRYVKALDRLNTISTSTVQSFTYTGLIDTTPDQFTLNTISSATIHTTYTHTVYIAWLSANTPVLASITQWKLYISGHYVGTNGYVQNGWAVRIELESSSYYNRLVTSTLTIGWVSAIFSITTETEAEANDITDYTDIVTNLSTTEKLQIIALFEALRDLYGGSKQDEFLNSFMVMLESKLDALGSSTTDTHIHEALQYLYDLCDRYRGGAWSSNTDISNTSRIIHGIYTAPNGKKYTITYDAVKRQFTSSNFLTPKYFPTLDVLRYTIDTANPSWSNYLNAKTIKARWWRIAIDWTRQTSPYTAPNGKVFYFFKTMEGQFSSYTFTVEKYFDSLDATKVHVYTNNSK